MTAFVNFFVGNELPKRREGREEKKRKTKKKGRLVKSTVRGAGITRGTHSCKVCLQGRIQPRAFLPAYLGAFYVAIACGEKA